MTKQEILDLYNEGHKNIKKLYNKKFITLREIEKLKYDLEIAYNNELKKLKERI